MKFFCRIFGHTWCPETRAPEPRWNTTKEGHTLIATSGEEDVHHVDVCRRCGVERSASTRRHDREHTTQSEPSEAASG